MQHTGARRLVVALATVLTLTGCGVRQPLTAPTAPAPTTVSGSTPTLSPTPADPTTSSTTAPATTTPPSAEPSSTPSPTLGKNVNCRKVKCVALTFDDGPGPDTTKLLKYLREADVKATFFMVGKNVAEHPDVAKSVAAAGHEIGVHTWSHPDLTRLSAAQVSSQVNRGLAIIRKETGAKPSFLRPPFGAMNAAVHTAARRAKLALALWSLDTLDWKTRSTPATVSAALKAKRNTIILAHDIHPWTVAAVPAIIKGLKKKGFTFVTVSTLLGKTTPGKKYF